MYVLMKSLRRERKVMVGGMSTAVVGSHHGVYELTVNLIKKKEDQIRGSFKVRTPSSVKISCMNCHDTLLKMTEWALHVWLEDEAQKGLSVVLGRGGSYTYTEGQLACE